MLIGHPTHILDVYKLKRYIRSEVMKIVILSSFITCFEIVCDCVGVDFRYCGVSCQQRDWPVHKQYCRENRRVDITEIPDR